MPRVGSGRVQIFTCIAGRVTGTPGRVGSGPRKSDPWPTLTCTPRVHPLTNGMNLSLPSQSKLVLIYRPRRDGRLSS